MSQQVAVRLTRIFLRVIHFIPVPPSPTARYGNNILGASTTCSFAATVPITFSLFSLPSPSGRGFGEGLYSNPSQREREQRKRLTSFHGHRATEDLRANNNCHTPGRRRLVACSTHAAGRLALFCRRHRPASDIDRLATARCVHLHGDIRPPAFDPASLRKVSRVRRP